MSDVIQGLTIMTSQTERNKYANINIGNMHSTGFIVNPVYI